jgi:hypothetical protein
MSMVAPAGEPGFSVLAAGQIGLSTVPSANQAPATAASHAPTMATGRDALASRMIPPRIVATPGTISSQIRPAVNVQAVSGVYA